MSNCKSYALLAMWKSEALTNEDKVCVKCSKSSTSVGPWNDQQRVDGVPTDEGDPT
jgi:hypothetical protein